MFSKIVSFLGSEFKDPAVQRGIIVVISMIAIKYGLKYGLDQPHADDLATGIWSALTILLARMPGKIQ